MATSAAMRRAYGGPAILSWGFRPFFAAAAAWAVAAMVAWLPLYEGRMAPPSAFAPVDWHVHEMLYGFVPAVVCGYLLGAIPNWTGHLPVLGRPLAALFGLWAAGRVAVALSDLVGPVAAGVVDVAFLFVLAGVAAREIRAGKAWRNLPVAGLVALLGLANAGFHAEAYATGTAPIATRAGLGLIVMLIALVGGRIVPSFTANWLARIKAAVRPRPFGLFDKATLAAMGLALPVWIARPEGALTAGLLGLAGGLGALRLARWQGRRVLADRLVLILHVGYGFVPLGFLLLAAHALGLAVPYAAGIHAWAAGAIGTMTLAVMTRSTLSHTGRPAVASRATEAIYAAIVLAALARIAMACWPEIARPAMHLAVLGWAGAFAGFLIVYGPMLARRHRGR